MLVSSADTADRFFTDRLDVIRAWRIVCFAAAQELGVHICYLIYDGGVPLFSEIPLVFKDALDHVLVPLSSVLMVMDALTHHLVGDFAVGGTAEVAPVNIPDRLGFHVGALYLTIFHCITEGDFSLPCHLTHRPFHCF